MPSRSEAQLGILRSGMRDSSVASLLGWSTTKVRQERDALWKSGDTQVAVRHEVRSSAAAPKTSGPNQKHLDAVAATQGTFPVMPAPAPRPAAAVRVAPPHREPYRHEVRQPVPTDLPDRVKRWCRWFLAAGWSPREVTSLFGLRVMDLRAGGLV